LAPDAAPPAAAFPLEGVVSAHPRGFGFVLCDSGEEHFVPPPFMKQFIPGDRVRFQLAVNPRNQQLAADRLQLVDRPESFWLGALVPGRNGSMDFAPDDAVHVRLQLPPDFRAAAADVVQVRVPPNASGTERVRVEVIQNLGPRNEREFDTRYATAKWRLPCDWPNAVADEAAALIDAQASLAPDMEDLRGLPLVTIDGESTRDFDDGICVRAAEGHFDLWVAIADVSRYVEPGSALDAQARVRGTSVYFPDAVIPMLPEVLSNGLCSLNPNLDRAAVVCQMAVSGSGRISQYRFFRALVRSRARLTYNQVASALDGTLNIGQVLRDDLVAIDVEAVLRDMEALRAALMPRRLQRGLMEYRSREPKLVVAADGSYAIGWDHPTVAHEMVEDCMLLANRAAAAHLALNGMGTLFRHHQGVDLEKWKETRSWLAACGVAAPETPTLEDLRALLDLTKDDERQPVIEWRVRRSFAPAVYDSANSRHYTLGFLAYTHFTSPIRRYADLLVHRLLLGEPVPDLEDKAQECSELSRRANIASRYPWDRLKRRALWAAGQGKVLSGQVVTMSKRGIKVVVADWDTAVFVASERCQQFGLAWDAVRDVWASGAVVLDLGQRVHVRLLNLLREGQMLDIESELVAP
jgi:ribonuclease R